MILFPTRFFEEWYEDQHRENYICDWYTNSELKKIEPYGKGHLLISGRTVSGEVLGHMYQ